MKILEMIEDPLKWLEAWYQLQCDGDWEHSFGVKIDTLDNPGWTVEVNLSGTNLELKSMDEIKADITDDNWIRCSVSDNKFRGYGGPGNLRDILVVFKKWASGDQ